jgi:hypothetical protein
MDSMEWECGAACRPRFCVFVGNLCNRNNHTGACRLRPYLLGALRKLQSFHKVDTSPYTIGPFTPQLNEVHSTDLRVIGEIPKELDGVYMRTGPNPQHDPHGGYVMCAPSSDDSSGLEYRRTSKYSNICIRFLG